VVTRAAFYYPAIAERVRDLPLGSRGRCVLRTANDGSKGHDSQAAEAAAAAAG
jgi:hypothetical protein